MSRKKREQKYILKCIIWIVVSLPFFYFAFAFFHDAPGLIYLSVIGVIILSCVILALKDMKKNLDRWEEFDEVARQRQEKANAIAGGTWDFPAQQFYEECNRLGIKSTDLDTPYSKAKCKVIADELMSNAQIPSEHRSLYNKESQLKEYYQRGKESAEREKLQQAEEAARYKLTSHIAELNDEQKRELSFLESLKAKTGAAKRDAMLQSIVDQFSQKISDIKTAQENMQKLGFILAQSASQQKTVDTATAAGLANGLGGPGAALYATADAMSRNAKIEAENRRNREAVNQMAAGMYSNSFALSSDINTLKKQRAPYDKALEELRTKVVIEGANTSELFKSLEIGKSSVEKLESGALSVKTSLKTSYRPDVPENVKTTVDGTLTGKVYAGDLYVGECVLPLPLYGVECGNPTPTQAETICGRFAANDQPYRVEFTPNKLWVMEL